MQAESEIVVGSIAKVGECLTAADVTQAIAGTREIMLAAMVQSAYVGISIGLVFGAWFGYMLTKRHYGIK